MIVEKLSEINKDFLDTFSSTGKLVDGWQEHISCVNGGIFLYNKRHNGEDLCVISENDNRWDVVDFLCKTSTRLVSETTNAETENKYVVFFNGTDEEFASDDAVKQLTFTDKVKPWNGWYEATDGNEFYYVKSQQGNTVAIMIPNAVNTMISELLNIVNYADQTMLCPLTKALEEFVERFPQWKSQVSIKNTIMSVKDGVSLTLDEDGVFKATSVFTERAYDSKNVYFKGESFLEMVLIAATANDNQVKDTAMFVRYVDFPSGFISFIQSNKVIEAKYDELLWRCEVINFK